MCHLHVVAEVHLGPRSWFFNKLCIETACFGGITDVPSCFFVFVMLFCSFLTTLLQLVVLVFHAFYAVCVVWGTWLVYIILCSLGRQPHTTNGFRLLMILCFDFQVVGSSVSSHVLVVVRRCNKSNIYICMYIYRHGNTKWALKFQSAVILHHGKQIKKRRDVLWFRQCLPPKSTK